MSEPIEHLAELGVHPDLLAIAREGLAERSLRFIQIPEPALPRAHKVMPDSPLRLELHDLLPNLKHHPVLPTELEALRLARQRHVILPRLTCVCTH